MPLPTPPVTMVMPSPWQFARSKAISIDAKKMAPQPTPMEIICRGFLFFGADLKGFQTTPKKNNCTKKQISSHTTPSIDQCTPWILLVFDWFLGEVFELMTNGLGSWFLNQRIALCDCCWGHGSTSSWTPSCGKFKHAKFTHLLGRITMRQARYMDKMSGKFSLPTPYSWHLFASPQHRKTHSHFFWCPNLGLLGTWSLDYLGLSMGANMDVSQKIWPST